MEDQENYKILNKMVKLLDTEAMTLNKMLKKMVIVGSGAIDGEFVLL